MKLGTPVGLGGESRSLPHPSFLAVAAAASSVYELSLWLRHTIIRSVVYTLSNLDFIRTVRILEIDESCVNILK